MWDVENKVSFPYWGTKGAAVYGCSKFLGLYKLKIDFLISAPCYMCGGS